MREREVFGVSSRTRSLSGTDYVMAKWRREREGRRNKMRRETQKRAKLGLSAPQNSSPACSPNLTGKSNWLSSNCYTMSFTFSGIMLTAEHS